MPPSAITGMSPAAPRGIHDRGQLRHADAGHHPRGADRARPDADLHRVRPGADQRPRRLGRGDVAGDHLDLVRQPLDPLDRDRRRLRNGHARCRPRSGRSRRRSAPGCARTRRRRPSSPPPPAAGPAASLQACGFSTACSVSFSVSSPVSLPLPVGDQQLLDPPRPHQAFRLVEVHRFAQQREVVGGHHRPDRGRVVRGEAHVAVGDDADDAALPVDHREAGDVVARAPAPWRRPASVRRSASPARRRCRDSNRFTRRTSAACSAMPRLRWITPRPPAWAIAIAIRASVTVSIAEEISGMFIRIARVTWVAVSAVAGSTRLAAGTRRTSSKVKRLANLHGTLLSGGIVWRFPVSRVRVSCKPRTGRPVAGSGVSGGFRRRLRLRLPPEGRCPSRTLPGIFLNRGSEQGTWGCGGGFARPRFSRRRGARRGTRPKRPPRVRDRTAAAVVRLPGQEPAGAEPGRFREARARGKRAPAGIGPQAGMGSEDAGHVQAGVKHHHQGGEAEAILDQGFGRSGRRSPSDLFSIGRNLSGFVPALFSHFTAAV